MVTLGRQVSRWGGWVCAALLGFLLVYIGSKVYKTDFLSLRLEHVGWETEWLGRNRLSLNPFMPRTSGSKSVLLYTYMRGGSTLLYEIFNQDPRAMAWYEPMAALYAHLYALPRYRHYHDIVFKAQSAPIFRTMTEEELQALVDMLSNMFTCNLAGLSAESLTNTFLKRSSPLKPFVECIGHGDQDQSRWEHECQEHSGIARYCGGVDYSVDDHPEFPDSLTFAEQNKCQEYLIMARENHTQQAFSNTATKKEMIFREYVSCMNSLHQRMLRCLVSTKLVQTCHNKTIRTAKILRIKMPFLDSVVQALPDMRLLYYTRDPGAIISSRLKLSGRQSDSHLWAQKMLVLCSEMKQDLEHLGILEARYPGLVLRLRYEDLVQHPNQTLDKLYTHFNERPLAKVQSWLYNAMHASQDDRKFGVMRKNATATEESWHSLYQEAVIEEVSQSAECKSVLASLDYL